MTAAVLDTATIRRLEPGLIRYAQRKVGREDVAKDLVQETWIAALGSIDSFAGRSKLRTWLVSILRRKIVDMHRRSRPQVSFAEHHVAPDFGFDQREALDDAAAVSLVETELENLPPRERDAIRLVDVKGLDRDDAAAARGPGPHKSLRSKVDVRHQRLPERASG